MTSFRTRRPGPARATTFRGPAARFLSAGFVAAGLLAAQLLAATQPAGAAETKKRTGPPPKVYTSLPNQCARCHKEDGRGGPAYGGFAADLRATELDQEGLEFIIADGIRDRGMPEFKSTMSKREIAGIATYILEKVKDHYYDANGNRITAEEAARLDPRLNDGGGKKSE